MFSLSLDYERLCKEVLELKVSNLPLDELYKKPKITPAVERAILEQEDFSSINKTYCTHVCKLRCKSFSTTTLQVAAQPIDILVVQETQAQNGPYDRTPGQQESVQQAIIRMVLRHAEAQSLNVRITSLLKCPLDKTEFHGKKKPTSVVMNKCRPYLLTEITSLKPKVILALGTAVCKALGLPKASVKNQRGHVYESQFGPVVISLHPRVLSMIRQNASGQMWSADYFEVIRRDFYKAVSIARGSLTVPSLSDGLEKVKGCITICRTIEQVREAVREISSLPSTHLVSWDIETNGLNGFANGAKMLCNQFGYKLPGATDYKSVVVLLWHRENTWYDPDEAWSLIAPIVSGDTPKIAWNGKFDCVFCAASTGVRPRNVVFDGLLIQHLLDSGANGTFSLKHAASDLMPELGLQGYENLLPDLGDVKPDEDEVGEDLLEQPPEQE
jgi:uracil-DNA glycosylase family 4